MRKSLSREQAPDQHHRAAGDRRGGHRHARILEQARQTARSGVPGRAITQGKAASRVRAGRALAGQRMAARRRRSPAGRRTTPPARRPGPGEGSRSAPIRKSSRPSRSRSISSPCGPSSTSIRHAGWRSWKRAMAQRQQARAGERHRADPDAARIRPASAASSSSAAWISAMARLKPRASRCPALGQPHAAARAARPGHAAQPLDVAHRPVQRGLGELARLRRIDEAARRRQRQQGADLAHRDQIFGAA